MMHYPLFHSNFTLLMGSPFISTFHMYIHVKQHMNPSLTLHMLTAALNPGHPIYSVLHPAVILNNFQYKLKQGMTSTSVSSVVFHNVCLTKCLNYYKPLTICPCLPRLATEKHSGGQDSSCKSRNYSVWRTRNGGDKFSTAKSAFSGSPSSPRSAY